MNGPVARSRCQPRHARAPKHRGKHDFRVDVSRFFTRPTLSIGGPVVATQHMETSFSKPYLQTTCSLRETHYLSEAPPPKLLDGFPRGMRPMGLPNSGFENFSMVWVAAKGPPKAFALEARDFRKLLNISATVPSKHGMAC